MNRQVSHKEFIKKRKKEKISVTLVQISIAFLFILLWETLAHFKVINTFIFSSPSLIIETILSLIKSNLFYHIFVTLSETLVAFLITTLLSILIAVIMYQCKFFSKVIDPYLTLLNSLPKVALGPIIIVWFGANTKSIIVMAILISIINSIQTIFIGFINTDKNKIKLIKTLTGSKKDILFKLVIPSNLPIIINSLKLNLAMCMVGVIMGEFLTSKAGIGYLILYGSQVFNLNLVMSGIVILMVISIIAYKLILKIEKTFSVS